MLHLKSPLGLQAKLKSPSIEIDAIPFLNVLTIAFFISLLSSKFLFAPGLTIQLPQSSETKLQGATTSAFLTVDQSDIIFFEGNIYTLDTIKQAFTDFIKSHPNHPPSLLAKINKSTDIDLFFNICEIAHNAGFEFIQLAANNPTSNPSKNTH